MSTQDKTTGTSSSTTPPDPATGTAWLDLCWRAAVSGASGLYPAVQAVLAERAPDPEAFSTAEDRYRYHAIRALLCASAGHRADARRHARDALVEKANGSQGFRFHPRPGTADGEEAAMDAQLVLLAQ